MQGTGSLVGTIALLGKVLAEVTDSAFHLYFVGVSTSVQVTQHGVIQPLTLS